MSVSRRKFVKTASAAVALSAIGSRAQALATSEIFIPSGPPQSTNYKELAMVGVAAAKAAGARRALPLPVSVPSHCALMRGAATALTATLHGTRLAQPAIPVIHNVDVDEHRDADAIRDALARQLWMPVRWTDTIVRLARQGVTRFVECGPGKVLAGLNRRIADDAACLALTDPDALAAAVQGD